MKRHLAMAVSVLSLTAIPSVAAACDFHGMQGMHRFNPFAQNSGFRNLPPLPPERPDKSRTSQADGENSKSTAKKQTRKSGETPVREWERDTGNGPISDEDKATFT